LVADAMVEADPIHSEAAAACIAVAQLEQPVRRTAIGNEIERRLHRAALRGHAARLPRAIDADVQRHRIVQQRPALSKRGA